MLGVISYEDSIMLKPAQIAAINALPPNERQRRYLELCNKVVGFIILTADELQELTALRESLQHDAEGMRYSPRATNQNRASD